MDYSPDFITAVSQGYANNYFSLASFVVMYYDYMVTLEDEIEYFWSRRVNTVTILYFLNRYLSLLGNIPVILQYLVNWSPTVCLGLQTYNQIFLVIVQLIVAVIITLRTYALYEKSRYVLATLFSVICCGIALAVWSSLGSSTKFSAAPGCEPILTRDEGIRTAVGWIGLLVFDTVVLGLTLHKSIVIWKIGSRRLVHVLARDGAIYFLIVTIVNLSNILTYILAPPILKGISTTAASVFSVTITSRLMLNIQNPALFETSGIQTTSTRMNPFVTTMVDRGSTSALDTYFSTDPSHLSPPTWYNSIWTRGNLHTDSEDIELFSGSSESTRVL